MRYARRTRSLAALAALAVLVPAAGASAADDATATVTFEVSGATSTDLSIAFADGASSSVTLAEGGGSVTGALPTTIVTDNRTGLLSGVVNTWNVQVSTGDHFWRQGDVDGEGQPVRAFAVPRNRAHVYLPASNAVSSLLGNLTVSASELSAGVNRLGPQAETAVADLPAHSYTLVSGTSLLGLLGRSQHQYTPQIAIELPIGQVDGTYSGTVTQTVSAGL